MPTREQKLVDVVPDLRGAASKLQCVIWRRSWRSTVDGEIGRSAMVVPTVVRTAISVCVLVGVPQNLDFDVDADKSEKERNGSGALWFHRQADGARVTGQ